MTTHNVTREMFKAYLWQWTHSLCKWIFSFIQLMSFSGDWIGRNRTALLVLENVMPLKRVGVISSCNKAWLELHRLFMLQVGGMTQPQIQSFTMSQWRSTQRNDGDKFFISGCMVESACSCRSGLLVVGHLGAIMFFLLSWRLIIFIGIFLLLSIFFLLLLN